LERKVQEQRVGGVAASLCDGLWVKVMSLFAEVKGERAHLNSSLSKGVGAIGSVVFRGTFGSLLKVIAVQVPKRQSHSVVGWFIAVLL
jgi:hypothetical protein